MNKERLTTFVDAVLAIIMTVLVLELGKPKTVTLAGFWALRESYLAYALSFFWLGAMWVNLHNNWYHVEKINPKIIWSNLILLFTASLFPYASSIVSEHFNNRVAQVFYGIVVLLITASNQFMYYLVQKANPEATGTIKKIRQRRLWARYDIAVKLLGLLLSITIYPPAVVYSVLFTLLVFVIPNQLKIKEKNDAI